jgi:hypothetical protein
VSLKVSWEPGFVSVHIADDYGGKNLLAEELYVLEQMLQDEHIKRTDCFIIYLDLQILSPDEAEKLMRLRVKIRKQEKRALFAFRESVVFESVSSSYPGARKDFFTSIDEVLEHFGEKA